MNLRTTRLLRAASIFSTLIVVVAVLAGCAQSGAKAATTAPPALATRTFTAKQQTAALAYWTPSRMSASGKQDMFVTGPLTTVWRGKPVAQVGRLFFLDENGQDEYCTATSVGGKNNEVVLAAAHCAWPPGLPTSDVADTVFVPGYDAGQRPAGVFAVRASVVSRDWIDNQHSDVAAFIVAPSAGKTLAAAVGTEAVSFAGPYLGAVRTFGYPASKPQNGEQLLTATGRTTTVPGQPDEIQMPCDMSGGASGGPWLAGANPTTGAGTLIAVFNASDPYASKHSCAGAVLGATAKMIYEHAGSL